MIWMFPPKLPSSRLNKQLIMFIKIQGVSEVDAILAVVAVDPSATSATGEREKEAT